MTESAMQIFETIKLLSPEDRTELIEMLNIEFCEPEDPDIEKAWIEESERRYESYIGGDTKTVSAEDVFEKIFMKK
jgi:putative addiction module component (TIGR02574 family)